MNEMNLETLESVLKENFEYVKIVSYDIRNHVLPRKLTKNIIDFDLNRFVFDFVREMMNLQVKDNCVVTFNKIQKLWNVFIDDRVLDYLQSLNSLYFGLYPKIRIISCNNQDVLIEIKFYSNYDKVKLKITLKI